MACLAVHLSPVPLQHDSYACGVYVCHYLQDLALEGKLPQGHWSAGKMQLELHHSLLQYAPAALYNVAIAVQQAAQRKQPPQTVLATINKQFEASPTLLVGLSQYLATLSALDTEAKMSDAPKDQFVLSSANPYFSSSVPPAATAVYSCSAYSTHQAC